MIRNLKVLLAAALALTALGAIAASAHAADEFHCSVSPCRGKLSTDGTGATAHQVLVIEKKDKSESVSFTCGSLRGTAEFISSTDISLGWNKATGEDREAYDECRVNGSPGVIWHMNECRYTFTAGAGGTTSPGTAEMHIICPGEQEIETTIPNSTCVLDFPSQTLSGIGYHNIGAGATREITVTMNVHGIVVRVRGDCSALIKAPANELEATFTTGNFLITGETSTGVMAEAWFE